PGRPLVKAFRNVLVQGEAAPADDAKPRPWVMVASTVDLAKQLAEYRKAGYPTDHWDLSAYEVQLQRRKVTRSSNAELASTWEDVSGAAPADRPALPNVTFAEDGSASKADQLEIEKAAKVLRDMQPAILRPDLPRVA